MTTPPEGAQMSEDGQYWWDGSDWQPAANQSVDPNAGGHSDAAGGAQAATPLAVHQSVTLVPQPTEQSCWAASIAMLVNETPEAVVEKAGMTLTDGYGWGEIQPAAQTWGLAELAPACGLPDVLAGWIQDNGPLWVVEVGAPYHAVVVAGVEGDGTPDGTHVTVYNPWPPGGGAIQQVTFTQFESDFELGAGSKASILHR